MIRKQKFRQTMQNLISFQNETCITLDLKTGTFIVNFNVHLFYTFNTLFFQSLSLLFPFYCLLSVDNIIIIKLYHYIRINIIILFSVIIHCNVARGGAMGHLHPQPNTAKH